MTITTVRPEPEAPRAGAAVAAFAAHWRRARLRATAAQTALRYGLPASVPCALVWSFAPDLLLPAGALAAAIVLAAVGAGLAHGRRLSLPALATAAGAMPVALGDGIATWLEQEQHGRGDAAMARWLALDLAAMVSRLPRRDPAATWRRLGAIRYLLPLLVVLLLLQGLALLLPLPTTGGLGAPLSGASGLETRPQPGNGAAAGEAGSVRPEPQPGRLEPAAAQPSVPEPPPPHQQPEPDPEPPVPPEPPAPFLDIPDVPMLVIPEFVRDGPTRRALAERAIVEDGGATAQPHRRQRGGDALRTGGDRSAEFARAAERAERSRHVPDEERDIVRRFFATLQERGR